MAIFHLSASIISRKAGRSSTAAAAYRSGEKIVDERTGEIHDYERKRGVEHSEIIVPSGMDAPERKDLWNAVEYKNKRADAQVAREITLALPHELTPGQRKELAQEFANSLANKYSLAVDLAIHAPGREGDTRNHHAHILMTTNRFEGIQNGEIVLGNKVRELDMIASAKAEKGKVNEIEIIREEWAHACNMALDRAGELVRVDNRSLSAQGIEREPTIHLGPAAAGIERRGEASNLGEINREIAELNAVNEHIELAKKEIEEINKILAEIQIIAPEEKIVKSADSGVDSNVIEEAKKARQREEEDKKLKEAACYGMTARDAYQKLHMAQEKLHIADINLYHAKEEQHEHNKKVDNMGFLSKAFSSGAVNQKAQEIDKKLETLTGEVERRKEDVSKLEQAHSILQNREREQHQQRASSPDVIREQQAEKERFLEQMRQKRERERGSRGR